MDTKDIGLAVAMVMSSLVLTFRWLTHLHNPDIIIIIASMILIGSLAAMILLLNMRLQALEKNLDETISAKERSLRINIKGVEENLENKMNNFIQKTNNIVGDISKKIYR